MKKISKLTLVLVSVFSMPKALSVVTWLKTVCFAEVFGKQAHASNATQLQSMRGTAKNLEINPELG